MADASTEMQNFYRLREAEKLTEAEASRPAQLQLLRGQARGSGPEMRRAA